MNNGELTERFRRLKALRLQAYYAQMPIIIQIRSSIQAARTKHATRKLTWFTQSPRRQLASQKQCSGSAAGSEPGYELGDRSDNCEQAWERQYWFILKCSTEESRGERSITESSIICAVSSV